MSSRTFTTTLRVAHDNKVFVPVPFDPNEAWGQKLTHHVSGTVNGLGLRAVVETLDDGFGIVLGPAWQRDRRVRDGQEVSVVLQPEGPQRGDLDPDVAAALDAEPAAGEFFDSIAQFYRKAYLTWIGATKRSPEKRAERIAEMVRLLKAGQKQRPGA
jgi:hypothetical protein